MEGDVVVASNKPARNGKTPKTFQIRQQQSYLLIDAFQLIVVYKRISFKGAVKPEWLIVAFSSNMRDGQRWQQRAQRRTRQEIETPPANERTISRKLEDVLRNGRSKQAQEGINKGKASASTIELAEGHGRSRAANGERDNSSWKGMAEAAPRTENAHHTPSQATHTWHKKGKVLTSTTKSAEGHGGSRAANGKHVSNAKPDDTYLT